MVVDDSMLMRELIGDYINQAPGMKVVGTASDGHQAIEKVASLRPDVVTLDIQMPRKNGLETLDAILARWPVPVIMVSALTQRGATTTLDALERGAVDYVAKPEQGAGVEQALRVELIRKIRAMAGTDVRHMLEIRRQRAMKMAQRGKQTQRLAAGASGGRAATGELADKCIAIGISTGGPPALATLFQSLGPPTPPILVVQHMPAHFTKPFAWRLNSASQLTVKEAATGDVLLPNHVYVAPGGRHMLARADGTQVKIRLREGAPVSGHKPSVDVMMESVAQIYGPRAIGVIMTGMGRDGAAGCRAIRAAGGFVLGQDEASSDVYGMNKVAYVEGHVDQQFDLLEAANVLVRQMKRRFGAAAAAV